MPTFKFGGCGVPHCLCSVDEKDGGKILRRFVFVSLLVVGQIGVTAPAFSQHIAGVEPSVRPVDAPVISEFKKDGAWYGLALTGVTPPYPASLRFLEDQGAWFNPFIHPGMPGPYDIRGWHDRE